MNGPYLIEVDTDDMPGLARLTFVTFETVVVDRVAFQRSPDASFAMLNPASPYARLLSRQVSAP
jgi:hypothetical protein